jgi:hypothetical protein
MGIRMNLEKLSPLSEADEILSPSDDDLKKEQVVVKTERSLPQNPEPHKGRIIDTYC